jgi:hypothetical protein
VPEIAATYDEWAVLVPSAIRYGPYDERQSAEATAAALTVPSRIQRRTVTVTRSEWADDA